MEVTWDLFLIRPRLRSLCGLLMDVVVEGNVFSCSSLSPFGPFKFASCSHVSVRVVERGTMTESTALQKPKGNWACSFRSGRNGQRAAQNLPTPYPVCARAP